MLGAQAKGTSIPEAVAMETVTVESEPTGPMAGTAEETTPELGTAVAPESGAEVQDDPFHGTSTDVVVRSPIIEEAAPIRSTAMAEEAASSRGGLELLEDNLVDPAVVALNMESWRRTQQWVKVRCEYLE